MRLTASPCELGEQLSDCIGTALAARLETRNKRKSNQGWSARQGWVSRTATTFPGRKALRALCHRQHILCGLLMANLCQISGNKARHNASFVTWLPHLSALKLARF